MLCKNQNLDKYFCRPKERCPLFSSNDDVDAAPAYDCAAVAECGAYTRVNFPQERPPERRREVHAAYQAALKKTRKKDPPKAKAEGNEKKAKAKVKKKKAKARHMPDPLRRKTNRSPQRARKTESRRNDK
jgi:hypothetical protein